MTKEGPMDTEPIFSDEDLVLAAEEVFLELDRSEVEPARPRATYRVQLRPGFGFDEAAALADYLADLGITHLYSSPYLQAAHGSTHGYDVVDPTRVNEELGGEEAHARLCRRLGEAGLGQVLDIG